jgi:hypothetical protein
VLLVGVAGCSNGASSDEPTGGTTASGGLAGAALGGAGAGGTMGGTQAGGAGATSAGSGGTSAGNGGTSTGGAGGDLGAGGGTGGASGSGANGGSGGGDAHSWDGCEEFVLPPDCTIPENAVLPGELRCTGLYSNFQERKLRCGVKEYAPAYELWADGARKQRYVWLPPGKTIDVSNGDDFDYPVGTRFWKEFHVGAEGSQKLGETRFLVRADVGWLYTAYVWDEQGSNATQQNDGVENLFATGHTVPSREQCKTCHLGRPNFVLGWDFIMLGQGATGVTARDLRDAGVLAGLDPAHLDIPIPGDEVEQKALSYLHANCGVSCHNTTVDATGNPSGLYLKLEVDKMDSPLATGAAKGINQRPAPNAEIVGIPELDYYDFRPGDPDRSLSYARMVIRGSDTAMPPLGTHVVDPAGVDLVKAWILSMTEARGYPPPAP